MKYITKFILFVGVFCLNANAVNPTVKSLFEHHYYKKYEARYCGKNTMGFLQSLYRVWGNKIGGFSVVSVTNKGGSVFGMVNVEKARETRNDRPVEVEMNWHYHAFVMDTTGLVYDFDFASRPRIVSLKTYLEEMFLNEPECDQPRRSGRFCVGRTTKLSDYEFVIVNALAALRKDESQKRTLRMKDLR